MSAGQEKAWGILSNLNPHDVCRKACVSYNGENGGYMLRAFGMDFSICPQKRAIKNISHEGEDLIKKYGYFFNLAVLFYLINARDIPLSCNNVTTENIKGGDIFFRGTHALPLNKVAERYGNNRAGFIERGQCLNGKILNYGDASIELLPMPRIPVTLILWLSDEEFPARADLLFDSTCEQHLPLDIIWSIAMMSLLVML